MTIKGRLLSSRLSPIKMGPKNDSFVLEIGGQCWYWFRDPQKVRPYAEPHRLTYFASKSVHVYLW